MPVSQTAKGKGLWLNWGGPDVGSKEANSRKPLLVRVTGGSRNQHLIDISP